MNAFTTMEPPGALHLREARRSLRFRKLVALFERDEIERAVDALIAHMDAQDGDTDLEDALGIEDAFEQHRGFDAHGPGCTISDPDYSVDEMADSGAAGCGDRSWTEWHTRGRHKVGLHGGEGRCGGDEPHEDAEDRVWRITRIAVNLAAFSGLRIGEILALRVPDVNLVERKVHVRHTLNRWDELTSPKSKDSARTVPIPEHVASLIAEWIRDHYLTNDRELLFRGRGEERMRLTQISFQRGYWQPLVQAAELLKTDKRSIHFHALRHFAASWWLRNRLPITEAAKMMGHADPSVTMRIYSHEMMEDAERVATFDTMAAAFRSRENAHGLRTGEKALEYQSSN